MTLRSVKSFAASHRFFHIIAYFSFCAKMLSAFGQRFRILAEIPGHAAVQAAWFSGLRAPSCIFHANAKAVKKRTAARLSARDQGRYTMSMAFTMPPSVSR